MGYTNRCFSRIFFLALAILVLLSGQIFQLEATRGLASRSGEIINVSAASFTGTVLAGESLVAAFGSRLASTTQQATTIPLPTWLRGTSVNVRDSAGIERFAPILFISPGQVNYQIPPGTAVGAATVTITGSDGSASVGAVQIVRISPGIFTANGNGLGAAAGVALRVSSDGSQKYESIIAFDYTQNRFLPMPIKFGSSSDRVYLILFGTGWRFSDKLSDVTVRLGGTDGVNAEVVYAGQQGTFVGIDQLSLLLPRTLTGGASDIEVEVTMGGLPANLTYINVSSQEQLPSGQWGGQGIGMQVTEKDSSIEFACAVGKIEDPFTLDKEGRFDLKGIYIQQSPGPVHEDTPPDNRLARYSGTVDKQKMTLTVMLTETREVIGTFTLIFGRQGRIVKCL